MHNGISQSDVLIPENKDNKIDRIPEKDIRVLL